MMKILVLLFLLPALLPEKSMTKCSQFMDIIQVEIL